MILYQVLLTLYQALTCSQFQSKKTRHEVNHDIGMCLGGSICSWFKMV